MNVQTHTSGPISGQVPNQAGSQMPVLSQHNGNALAPQMQNLGGPARVMSNMDPELLSARQIVQDRICQIIRQRQLPQPMNDRKFREIVKKLDEGLLRSARDKDDYMNPETLESRLHNLIKQPPNQSQQFQQAVNSSSPAGVMIPTPGMSHSGNSNMMVTSSMDASMNTTRGSTGIAPMTVNTGNLVPTGALHGGSFNRSDGSISNGYQQSPASLSVGAGGNISSMGVQRMASQIVQDRICQIIRQRQLPQPMNDRKLWEIVKKLDEGLLRSARDKDDYMNPETLESRLHNLIKQPPNQSQQFQQAVNSSSPAGVMIPTPGMSHSGNSNMMVTSSMDASMNTTRGSTGIAPMTVNTGNLVPTGALHGGSFNRSDGSISNGYQQSPASLSVGAGGNISSMGVQRMASQMIPTPGFNSSNNQSYMNLDSSNNGGGFCTVDSLMVTQPQQQQQHIGGQNSRILHSLGSQINTGIRSGMQQKSYGLPNGALNGGLGFGNSLPVVNESGTSEGYLTSTPYANSSKPLQQHFDQHQRPVMQGDSYGMSNADSFVPGNYYGAATSVGSMLNPQNLNSVSSIPVSKAISPLVNSQSNMHGAQQSVHAKPQQPDQLEKIFVTLKVE